MSGLVINHNLGSMNALAALNQNQNALQSMLQQLSTGKQINSAADNAAGYAISQKMQAQINGLDQASQNSQDGISLLQTASGALDQTQSILQRMRQLAVQSSNDTNTSQDRQNLQAEVTQLTQQIDTIANTTQFNTKNLLNGGAGIQANITDTSGNASNTLSVSSGGSGVVTGAQLDLTSVTAATQASVTFTAKSGTADNLTTGSNAAGYNIQINGVNVNLSANESGTNIAAAINAVTGQTGVTATYTSGSGTTPGQLKLTSTQVGSSGQINITGLTSAGAATDTFYDATGTAQATSSATITSGALTAAGADAQVAYSATNATATAGSTAGTGVTVTSPTSWSSSGNTVTFHGGSFDGLSVNVASTANGAGSATDIHINANDSLNLQIGANQGQTMNVSISSMTSAALGVNNIDITSTTSAQNAITTLDSALQTVSLQQAQLGAYQNRLQDSISNVETSSQNLTTAQSGITDTNMASAMANFTKDNVLQQAAISMLAQANQQPQLVLKLLG